MFSHSLEQTLNNAYSYARQKRHEWVSVEHLLLALIDGNELNHILTNVNIDIKYLRDRVINSIDQTTTQTLSQEDYELQPTVPFQRVIQRSIFQVQAMGKTEVTSEHMFSSILAELESHSVYILKSFGLTQETFQQFLLGANKNFNDENSLSNNESYFFMDHSPQDSTLDVAQPETIIDKFTVNMNRKVIENEFDPVIGRQKETKRVIQVLSRRIKNNPLLIGESGVGKTSIIEGLARNIVNGQVSKNLLGCTVYKLDLAMLLAGTKYRGDFEKRFKSLFNELENDKSCILFIDEIHTIVGAGAASGGAMDAANLLKPLLTKGSVQCIGATTYHEYRNSIQKDKALVRRFQKIDIAEPTRDETLAILKELKDKYESHHNVKYTMAAVHTAVDLSIRYMNDRFLPDKAIDIIDEAGARQSIKSKKTSIKTLGKQDIELTFSQMVNIPAHQIKSSDRQRLKYLERDLTTMVFGQKSAISAVSNAIKLSKSGLGDENKPIGSLLFAGPTGVGKTEVCIQLANLLGIKLLRFDMSEYMEKHSVSQLIGAPAGYVGYDQGGFLTESVIKHPHAVLLLDEVEKAHPDLMNVLLQVMDYGKLTDNNGNTADFRHVIMIMTCNTGADCYDKNNLGFVAQDNASDNMEAINQYFRPEFRNRLDSIIQFNPLNEEVIELIVEKFITRLEVQLDTKGVCLKVSDSVKKWLAINGFDSKMGARPMERLINETIKKTLANEILFGKLSSGGKAKVLKKMDKITIETDSS